MLLCRNQSMLTFQWHLAARIGYLDIIGAQNARLTARHLFQCTNFLCWLNTQGDTTVGNVVKKVGRADEIHFTTTDGKKIVKSGFENFKVILALGEINPLADEMNIIWRIALQ